MMMVSIARAKKKTRVEMARIPHETFCALFAQFTNHFNTERNGEAAAL